MILKTGRVCACLLVLMCLVAVNVNAAVVSVVLPKPADVQFITAEELKSKISKNEAIAILDVRATSGLLEADNKIKGAVYVKLRRLKSRLGLPPLKDVPRDREVVTYCACPNDESSIHAAQVLIDAGFTRVRVLKGGWMTWKKVNGQVEPLAKVM
jgi:rhodanese-related sulfurtransferase